MYSFLTNEKNWNRVAVNMIPKFRPCNYLGGFSQPWAPLVLVHLVAPGLYCMASQGRNEV